MADLCPDLLEHEDQIGDHKAYQGNGDQRCKIRIDDKTSHGTEIRTIERLIKAGSVELPFNYLMYFLANMFVLNKPFPAFAGYLFKE